MERTKVWVVTSHAGVEGVYWDKDSADVRVSTLKPLIAYKGRENEIKAEPHPVLGGEVIIVHGQDI